MVEKNRYLYIYIFLTILNSEVYLFDSFVHNFRMVYVALLIMSQIYILFFGTFLLIQDYKLNHESSVLQGPFVKWILLFNLYLLILTIFHKTTFEIYNNAFFILHSSMFFFITLIYCDKYKWIKSCVKIALLFTGFIGILSIITTLLYLVTNTFLFDAISSENLRATLLSFIPMGSGFLGLFNTSATYSHLLVYSIYLLLFLLVYYKRTKLKYLFMFLIVNDVFNLFISKDFIPIFVLITTSIIFVVLYIVLSKKYSYIKPKAIVIIVISASIIVVGLFVVVMNCNFGFCKGLRTLLFGSYKTRSEVYEIWRAVFSLDPKYILFGASDSQMYSLIKDIVPASVSSGFINNSGRYHNMFLAMLGNYGIFAMLWIIALLAYSAITVIQHYIHASYRRKRFELIFGVQLLAILLCGCFEEFPLFTQSLHSLLFMFTLSMLYGLTYMDKIRKSSHN